MNTNNDALISRAREVIEQADAIVIAAGAGLSAAGGINYGDPDLFERLYPDYAKHGFSTIWNTITNFWDLTDKNKNEYWAFWATHINNIRYQFEPTQPYLDLIDIIGEKPYYVMTTNTDHQFIKAGFDPDKVYAMQGNYGWLQCPKPCHHSVYSSEDYVKHIIENMDRDKLSVADEYLPRCPKCNRIMEPNLRKDMSFVQEPSMVNKPKFNAFTESCSNKKLVILELGVGFNSPGAIRYPVEMMTFQNPNWFLIRINRDDPETPIELQKQCIVIQDDLAPVIHNLKH